MRYRLLQLSLMVLILHSISQLFRVSQFRRFPHLALHALRVVEQTLFVYHRLQQVFCRLELVPVPVEHLFTNWLLLVVVGPVKVRVS
jgi:hypothetical protein